MYTFQVQEYYKSLYRLFTVRVIYCYTGKEYFLHSRKVEVRKKNEALVWMMQAGKDSFFFLGNFSIGVTSASPELVNCSTGSFLDWLTSCNHLHTHIHTDVHAQTHNTRGLENPIHILQLFKWSMETESIQIDSICKY